MVMQRSLAALLCFVNLTELEGVDTFKGGKSIEARSRDCAATGAG